MKLGFKLQIQMRRTSEASLESLELASCKDLSLFASGLI